MTTEPILESIFEKCEASKIPITLADPDLPDSPLIFANSAFEKLTGYTKKDVEGRNCRFLQGEKTVPRDVETLRTGIASNQNTSCCILNYRADGSIFHNMVFVSRVNLPNDKPLLLGSQFHFDSNFLRTEIDHHVEKFQFAKDHYFRERDANRKTYFESLQIGAQKAPSCWSTHTSVWARPGNTNCVQLADLENTKNGFQNPSTQSRLARLAIRTCGRRPLSCAKSCDWTPGRKPAPAEIMSVTN